VESNRLLEQQLVERCRAGDRTAQRALYERYAKAMFNISLRMMGNRMEAEDMLQESMVDVFTKLDSYRGEATIGSWIKRIVINNCINTLRKRKVNFTTIEDYHEPIDLYSSGEEQLKAAPCSADKIRSAIMELPTGYRTVCSLYMIEGYDHQEIAGILGISESTSKTQYHRGKRRLKEYLVKEGILQ